MKSQHYLEQWVEKAIDEGEKDWALRRDKGKVYSDIEKEPRVQRVEGYCLHCKETVIFRGKKATNKYGIDTTGEHFVTDDWVKERCTAYYIGKCKCGGTITKRITNKSLDGYFKRSKKVLRARNQYKLDILQPNDEGYTAMYGGWGDQLLSGNIKNNDTLEDFL